MAYNKGEAATFVKLGTFVHLIIRYVISSREPQRPRSDVLVCIQSNRGRPEWYEKKGELRTNN